MDYKARQILVGDDEDLTLEEVQPDSFQSILSSHTSSSFRAAQEHVPRKLSWERMPRDAAVITVQDLPAARPLENEATECLLQALDSRRDLKQIMAPQGGRAAVLSNISTQDVGTVLQSAGWEHKAQEEEEVQHQPQRQPSSLPSLAGKDSESLASVSSRRQLSRASTMRREKSYRPAVRHRRTETVRFVSWQQIFVFIVCHSQ